MAKDNAQAQEDTPEPIVPKVSRPAIIACDGPAAVPPAASLRAMITPEQHVELQIAFPATPARPQALAVMRKLFDDLPDCTVFLLSEPADGVARIAIYPIRHATITVATVLAHAEEITAAARLYRTTARELMTRVAEKLGVSPQEFRNPLFRFECSCSVYDGELGTEWCYAFHGFECRLDSRETGQIVDVDLGFDELGVLDPFRFAQFVHTTPGLKPVASLFNDCYWDPDRAMQILEAHGYLVRLPWNGREFIGDVVGEAWDLIAP